MGQLIEKMLGIPGKLISFSKSLYKERYPKNIVVFNGNVCTKENKIWYGDLDITLCKDKLIELSKELNETIYILYEMDGRFENENNPLINNYLIKFNPNGSWEINEKYKKYYNL